jgi:hypothetical protein
MAGVMSGDEGMTAAIINIASRKRLVKSHPTREDSRRKGKPFDRDSAFIKTRKEIERHARYVRAWDSDDLPRWLVAWCWFKWRPTDLEKITDKMIQTVAVSAAHRMGCRDLSDEDALTILEEARDYQRHMKADALANWLGCTWADRCALRLTRIGACDKTPEQRKALAKERREQCRRARRRREPRAKWLAKTVAAEARRKGVSRMTIYRRRKRKQQMLQCVKGDVTGVAPAEERASPSARARPVTSIETAKWTSEGKLPWWKPEVVEQHAQFARAGRIVTVRAAA